MAEGGGLVVTQIGNKISALNTYPRPVPSAANLNEATI